MRPPVSDGIAQSVRYNSGGRDFALFHRVRIAGLGPAQPHIEWMLGLLSLRVNRPRRVAHSICRTVLIIKLVIMYFSPPSHCFSPLQSKHSPQYHVLTRLQPVLPLVSNPYVITIATRNFLTNLSFIHKNRKSWMGGHGPATVTLPVATSHCVMHCKSQCNPLRFTSDRSFNARYLNLLPAAQKLEGKTKT